MSTIDVNVRRALPDDAATILGLLRDFNAEFGETMPGLDTLEPHVTALLDTVRFWALLAGDPVVGVITVAQRDSACATAPALYVEDLYVVPDRRGRGIGSALIARLFDEAATRGASLIEIGVDESDVDAMRFYERLGFIHRDPETGERAFHIYCEL